MLLEKEELLAVTGGEVNVSLVAGISAAIAILISIVDGFLNPNKCIIWN